MRQFSLAAMLSALMLLPGCSQEAERNEAAELGTLEVDNLAVNTVIVGEQDTGGVESAPPAAPVAEPAPAAPVAREVPKPPPPKPAPKPPAREDVKVEPAPPPPAAECTAEHRELGHC